MMHCPTLDGFITILTCTAAAIFVVGWVLLLVVLL